MKIGQASVLFKSYGCVVCGGATTERSEVAERIKIIIGDRRAYLPLYRCARHARTAIEAGARMTVIGKQGQQASDHPRQDDAR